MAITQYLAVLNSLAKSFIAGSDGNGNLAPAHTLVDQNGVPVSPAAPLPVTDAAAETSMASLLSAFVTTSASTTLATLGGYLASLAGTVSSGKIQIAGAVTTTLAGFTPNGSGATLSAGTTSSAVALPSGTTVAVTNTGSSGAYIALGGSTVIATSGSGIWVPGGGSVGVAVGTNTYIAALTGSGTTALALSGGSGLWSNTAGSSTGGGGGGPVTQSGVWSVGLTGTLPDTSAGSLAAIASSVASGATAANQTTGLTSLSTIAGAQGASGTGISAPTGGSGLLGWVSGIYSKLSGTLSVAVTGTVPVSGTFYQTTQPVSGTVGLSGTLPDTAGGSLGTIATNTTGLASAVNQAAGNSSLSTIAAAQGAGGTGITQPSGGSGLLGWLSGIYATLKGTLTVSVTGSLPDTAGGSLAAIVTAETAGNTSLATLAGAVSSGRVVISAPLSYSSSTSGTVTTTSGTLVSAGAFTHTLQIWNNGTATIWLNPTGSAAVVGAGAPIPAGGALIFGAIDLPIPTAAITAISSLGSVSVSMVGG